MALIFALLTAFNLNGYSQTEALYSSYLFNGLSINPAYAGSLGCLNLNLWGKKQWIGVEGAPASVLFTAHTPLPKERMAVGLTVFNESWGINRQTGISGIYAYHMPLAEDVTLSAGLQAGLINLSANFTSLTMKTDNDLVLNQDQSRFIPDFSAGIFVYSKRVFAGVSASHLQRAFFTPSVNYEVTRRQYFLTSGVVFDLSEDLKLKPSILLRATEGSGIQGDANINLLIREVLWTGISYRSTGSLILITQMKLNQSLDLGYAIDINNSLTDYKNYLSHELMLNYRLAFRKSEITTPKYF